MADILMHNNDLMVASGDFVLGDPTNQNIGLIIRVRQGGFKQSPLTGYGEQLLLNGTFDGAARRKIQLQLEADGIRVQQMEQLGQRLYISGTT